MNNSPASPPDLSHSLPSSSSSSLIDQPISPPLQAIRANEHLAVLLPRSLWKSDSESSVCDNFYCRVPFNVFERKHHCRKCGGVFCSACSTRTTPLLDSSTLSFIHPPRNTPISAFESPNSPVVNSRVCDDCWDQIHGCPSTPHTPDATRPSFKRALTHPISMLRFPLSPLSAPTSPHPDVGSPMDPAPFAMSPISEQGSQPTPVLRNRRSFSSLSSGQSMPPRPPHRPALRTSRLPLPQDLERSYGELDAYPLRRSSVLCKATGGGRWEPKETPVLDGYRPPVPGGKAPFELEMERQELLDRQRRSNPIVKDGDFQYRFLKEPEPVIVAQSPYQLSTF